MLLTRYQAPLSPVKSKGRAKKADKAVRDLSDEMQDDAFQYDESVDGKQSKKRTSTVDDSGGQSSRTRSRQQDIHDGAVQ